MAASGDGKELSYPALQVLLNGLQVFLRQIEAFMPFESEADHPPKLLFLLGSHDLRAHLLIGDVVGVRTGFRILVQMGIILFPGIAEQGQPIVKNGGRGG